MESNSDTILWLGGAPCAGKSSIARLLGERFELGIVHVDDSFDACASQLDKDRHPALSEWMALNWNERWMREPEVLLSEVIACYREHLGFVIERLGKERLNGRRILVEGSAILPAEIAPRLSDSAAAVWLIPTPKFQAEHYACREWVSGILAQCSDRTAAFERWMGRDASFARWLVREVQQHGLSSVEIDGSEKIGTIAQSVAVHFGLVDS